MFGGKTHLVTPRGLSPLADTPEAIREESDRKWRLLEQTADYRWLQNELSATVTFKNTAGEESERPKHSPEKAQQLKDEYKAKWGTEPETSTPPQEQGGAADSRQRASAAPSAAPSANTETTESRVKSTRESYQAATRRYENMDREGLQAQLDEIQRLLPDDADPADLHPEALGMLKALTEALDRLDRSVIQPTPPPEN